MGDGGSCVCNKNTWFNSVEVIIFLPSDQNRISFFFSFAGWEPLFCGSFLSWSECEWLDLCVGSRMLWVSMIGAVCCWFVG